ncbi:tetratricopeptide repeat protein, partial [Candidatus Poribacteria bacterium]|nr:tetratricopeptide repeat protein [Candidatus Poribacteria bacterium]
MAGRSVRSAYELDPNSQPVLQLMEAIKGRHCELGRDYLNQGNLSAAEESASHALRLDPDYQPVLELLEDIRQAYYKLGLNLLNELQYDAAIAAFEETVNRYPKFTEAHCELGWAYLRKGNLAAAESSANEALRLVPNYQ